MVTGGRTPSVSIIVPVLDEQDAVAGSLQRLCRDFPGCEIVVVDGGSVDRTRERAAPLARIVDSAAGRARQMNAGAAATTGDVLWFVHVDCVVPAAALTALYEALTDPRVVAGGLALRFDRRGAGLDWLAWTSNHRARRLGWIFGDQALFVRRAVFEAVGGYPDLPLMEDLALCRTLRRAGRLVVLPTAVIASSRRLVANGPWRMTLLMQSLKVRYFLGGDLDRIQARYEAGTHRGRRRCATERTT